MVLKFPKEKISDDLHRVARLISSPDVVAVPATAGSASRWWTRFGTRTSQA